MRVEGRGKVVFLHELHHAWRNREACLIDRELLYAHRLHLPEDRVNLFIVAVLRCWKPVDARPIKTCAGPHGTDRVAHSSASLEPLHAISCMRPSVSEEVG